MKNVEMTVKGNKLVITVDLTQDFGPSSTGKTQVIATTAGTAKVPGHEDVIVGLNVNRKAAKAAA